MPFPTKDLPIYAHSVHFHHDFLPQFKVDLTNAKALVLIQSPWVTDWRLRQLQHHLSACVQRGVRVCAFVRKPDEYSKTEEENALNALSIMNMLTPLGVHVTFHNDIHEKVAVIDEDIAWDGSLNILSHRVGASTERMTRWVSRPKAQEIIHSHRLYACTTCGARPGFCIHPSGDWDPLQQRQALGQSIAQRRKALGLSQRELAELAGLTQRSVCL